MTLLGRVRRRLQARRQLRKLGRPETPRGVVVATFRDAGSAYVAAGSLQAEGIRAFVWQDNPDAVYGAMSGPMQVVVRPEDEESARRHLAG